MADKLIAEINRDNEARKEWGRIQKAQRPTAVIAGIRVFADTQGQASGRKSKEATPGTLASEIEQEALEEARKAAKCPQGLYDVMIRRLGSETTYQMLKSSAVPVEYEGPDQSDAASTLKSAVKQWEHRQQIGQIFGDLAGKLTTPPNTFLGLKLKR